ncbi:MAG TPA: BatB protein [Porticoccaceae bacterium]|nr:BatB protein [Porticoccaceae bacterium]
MLTLAWPWLLLALPLPWLYRLWRRPRQTQRPALLAPGLTRLALDNESDDTRKPSARQLITWVLLTLVWASCLLAASRPQWLGQAQTLPATGRDLLLAVDISPSMEVEDMTFNRQTLNRLQAVKSVVGEFVERRVGDRLGLILFGNEAHLQAPLTFDRVTVNTLLREALIGFAGDGTAVGDALGLAVKRLADRPENARVVILLTDGANNAGTIEPLKAAELASGYGVKVYTIGIGADELVRNSLFGPRRFNPSRDLDEKTLKTIAELTGGRYFRARDPEDLAGIYATLDELEPVTQAEETFRPSRSLAHWPLALALVASFCLAGLQTGTSDDG